MGRFALQALVIVLVVGTALAGLISLVLTNIPKDDLPPIVSSPLRAFGPRVEVASEVDRYGLKLNKNILKKQAEQLGVFSRNGVTLPGAEYASPTVPREQLQHVVKHLRVVLAYDNSYPLDETSVDVVSEPVGRPSARLVDGGETLEIAILLHPESLRKGRYTSRKLSIWVSGVVTAYLSQVTGDDYTEATYLREAETKAKYNVLPIIVTESM